MLPPMTGRLLVAAQAALLAWLAWAARDGLDRAPVWGLLATGAAVGLWAVRQHPRGNFRIAPEPVAGGRLVTTGPYRWIRHPMYAAVLLAAAGLSLAATGATGWLAWSALAAVLAAKATLEERALAALHPGWDAYRRVTRRLVPGLW